MSELRKQLESAVSDYRATGYDGDLAAELLRKPMKMPATALIWRRFLPLVMGAMAAMIAIVFWQYRVSHAPSQLQIVQQLPTPSAAVPLVWPAKLTRLHAPPYVSYVMDMHSGMREAILQLSGNVDGALEAPLVSDSVQTVRHVAGELQEFAMVTWSQLRPRKEPGC